MACLWMATGMGFATVDGTKRCRNREWTTGSRRKKLCEGEAVVRSTRYFLSSRSFKTLRGVVVVVDCSLASGCVNGDESQPGKRGRMLSERPRGYVIQLLW